MGAHSRDFCLPSHGPARSLARRTSLLESCLLDPATPAPPREFPSLCSDSRTQQVRHDVVEQTLQRRELARGDRERPIHQEFDQRGAVPRPRPIGGEATWPRLRTTDRQPARRLAGTSVGDRRLFCGPGPARHGGTSRRRSPTITSSVVRTKNEFPAGVEKVVEGLERTIRAIGRGVHRVGPQFTPFRVCQPPLAGLRPGASSRTGHRHFDITGIA